MSDVKRYHSPCTVQATIVGRKDLGIPTRIHRDGPPMEEDDNGDYVKYSDYQAEVEVRNAISRTLSVADETIKALEKKVKELEEVRELISLGHGGKDYEPECPKCLMVESFTEALQNKEQEEE